MEILNSLIQYLPTSIVALILGIYGNKVLRAGKADDKALGEAANRLKETQIVLDTQSKLIEQLNKDLERERNYARDTEDRLRTLNNIVVGQIELAAAQYPPDTSKENTDGN